MADQQNADVSIPFILPAFSLRGRLVRLQDVSTTVVSQHDYPYPLQKVLAELLAAGATLSGLLKYDGVFLLQTKTDGPVNLTVVDITHDGHMRGYAQFRPQDIKKNDTFQELLGRGYLAFTVDQGLKIDRYQGIVTLDHETLPSALEHYFDQSEQLKSRLFIASEKTDEGIWKSSSLLLQELPEHKVDEDAWVYMESLLKTLSPQEFLDFSIPYETLLTRLFHEGDVAAFDPIALKAQCRCSEQRIKTFLSTLTHDEIESLLEKGELKMTCEFCNHDYTFKRQDLLTVH
ncbi:MAG TPA: Hsp33 family molecular chaperone HslO [Alphaproteobacteria bacterium]|nr:Hsp33 family molecular chaperone HslO [Alphaproteobacteria bacterium]